MATRPRLRLAVTVAADAASRRRPARSDRSRLARHWPGESVPAADSAGALCCRCISAIPPIGSVQHGAVPLGLRGVFRGRHRHCGGRPAPDAQPAGNHLRPRHGRRRGHQLAAVLQRIAAGLGILFVVPVGAWRCWPTAAIPSSWRLWPRWPCSPSRSRRISPASRPATTSRRGNLRRYRVPGGAAVLAPGLAAARHRSRRPSPAGPGESRATVAVHRAEPAREHRGGGPREPHPADQRIRRAVAG